MGTNYYLERDRCEACGHSPGRLHIGKGSAGWCFSLHVIPEMGLSSLDDWKSLLRANPDRIRDEYGDSLTIEEMLRRITDRRWPRRVPASFLRSNHAIPGPNNLARHEIGPYCVGHGEGTWDLIPGEFS